MALIPLAEAFSDLILSDQDCFASEEGSETLLQLLPDREVVADLRDKWSKNDSSSDDKWKDLKRAVKKTDDPKRKVRALTSLP